MVLPTSQWAAPMLRFHWLFDVAHSFLGEGDPFFFFFFGVVFDLISVIHYVLWSFDGYMVIQKFVDATTVS